MNKNDEANQFSPEFNLLLAATVVVSQLWLQLEGHHGDKDRAYLTAQLPKLVRPLRARWPDGGQWGMYSGKV